MGLLFLSACAHSFGDPGVARRFISLRHAPSGETVNVLYVHDWRYDSAALGKINRICRDRHNGEEARIDPKLMDFIADMRDSIGLPETATFDILSCYRSSDTNAALAQSDRNVARNSLHMKGRAIDLRVPNLTGKAMAGIARTMQRGGVAFYPKSGHVHIDTGGVRTWNGG
ncbi:MAG: DUF882 domain-containing protein [Alphaproteobacteria bacterium]